MSRIHLSGLCWPYPSPFQLLSLDPVARGRLEAGLHCGLLLKMLGNATSNLDIFNSFSFYLSFTFIYQRPLSPFSHCDFRAFAHPEDA